MGIEVYAFKWFWKFKSRVSVNKFFFRVDNMSGADAYEVATALGPLYFSGTDWALHLTGLFSSHSFLHQITVKRILPDGNAAHRHRFPPGAIAGRFLGQCADNFTTANLQFFTDGDSTGKHQVRLSPLGEGATDGNYWSAFFVLNAIAFVAEHTAPRLVLPGCLSQGCIHHQTTGGTPITHAQLAWPPGRQANRRWRM